MTREFSLGSGHHRACCQRLTLRGRALTCLIVIGSLIEGVGCDRPSGTAEGRTGQPVEVTVAVPIERKVTDYDTFQGRTAAVESVELRPRVSGYLVKVNFVEGQEVEAGDTLFEIDPREYQIAVDGAKAEVARQEARVKLGAADFARYDILYRRNAASREDLDKYTAMRDEAIAALAAAKAQADRDELNLSWTKVEAPISGRASRALVTEGNLVGQESLLTTIVSMDPMYVYFDVDERTLQRYQATALAEGQPRRGAQLKEAKIPVEMGLASDERYPHKGLIDFAENRVSASTGTIEVRARFENPDWQLTAGEFARVRVERATYPAILVPEQAILTDQGRKSLYVVESRDGRDIVVDRFVVLGRQTDDGLRAIAEGLSPGERVIVNGMLRVRPGMPVTVTVGRTEEYAVGPAMVPVDSGPLTPRPRRERSDVTGPTVEAVGDQPGTEQGPQ